MFFLYFLLRELYTVTCGPKTRVRYGLPLLLRVSAVFVKIALELIIAAIAVDIIVVGDFFPSALAKYMLSVLLMTTPCVCVLVTILILSGLMIEE